MISLETIANFFQWYIHGAIIHTAVWQAVQQKAFRICFIFPHSFAQQSNGTPTCCRTASLTFSFIVLATVIKIVLIYFSLTLTNTHTAIHKHTYRHLNALLPFPVESVAHLSGLVCSAWFMFIDFCLAADAVAFLLLLLLFQSLPGGTIWAPYEAPLEAHTHPHSLRPLLIMWACKLLHIHLPLSLSCQVKHTF